MSLDPKGRLSSGFHVMLRRNDHVLTYSQTLACNDEIDAWDAEHMTWDMSRADALVELENRVRAILDLPEVDTVTEDPCATGECPWHCECREKVASC